MTSLVVQKNSLYLLDELTHAVTHAGGSLDTESCGSRGTTLKHPYAEFMLLVHLSDR